MTILINDTVVVIAGKHKGKRGTVKKINTEKNRVIVDGVNKVTKHVKAQGGQPGQKIEKEASIHRSNVMIFDKKADKGTRVGHTRTDSGEKVRISKASGEELAKPAFKKS